MACPGGERVVLIASGSSGGGGGGGNNNNSVTGRNCAVCDKNKANPCRDLCQACYNKWVASGKKRCARCRKRKVDGKYDLCVTCYGEWKLRTQEDDFAGMPADEAAELRELCVEVLCSDRDVVAKKLSESELWADYAVPNESLEETCPICLTELCDEPCVKLNCCTHVFHKDCIRGCLGQATYIKCPLCSAIVGTYVGSQPPGKMLVSFQKARTIEGCRPGSGLIYVTYEIPGGRQGKNHPHPGKPFTGTFREAYFPNTPEGRRVVRMMKVAFKRKLVFTVGTSVTSGKENTVVWNGIHHKTHPGGGAERHGYPDPTYLKRVEEELASFGVTAPPLPVKKDTHDGQSIEGFVSMAGGQWNKMNVYDGARVLNKSPSPVGSPKPVDDPSKEAKAAPAPAPADADEGHGEKVIDKGSEKQCDGPVEEERASVEHKNESDVTDDVKDANPATLESSSGDGKDGKKKDKKKKKKKKKNEKVEEEEM